MCFYIGQELLEADGSAEHVLIWIMGRTVAGLLQLIQQLPGRHGSHAKLSISRLRRVISDSHSR